MVDEKRVPDTSKSGEKSSGRRKFIAAVVIGAGAVISAVAGFSQLKREREQPSVISAATTGLTGTSSGAQPPADLVLVNGKVITVDPQDSIVEAVAISQGKIIKVGANSEVQVLIDQNTEVVDLKGKTVTPGLIDSHCHIGGGYPEKYYLDLRPGKADSIDEIVRLVAKKVEETPKGEWVLGFGWFPAYWSERRLPNRFDLDPVSPDNPVFLTDMSGWYGWVNSYALRLAGIDENTPNPLGGIIDRDKTSNMPTGLLVNHSAICLLYTSPSPRDRTRSRMPSSA